MKNLKRNHFIFNSKPSTEDVLKFDQELDEYFGINGSFIENEIDDSREGSYQGIDSRALSTSYIDYFQILERIPKDQTLIDIGAGYCRGSFLANELDFASCISIEFVEKRAKKALDHLGNNTILVLDLLNSKLPRANHYYLYFPKGEVLDHVIRQLIEYANTEEISLFVCESHGDVLEYLDAIGFERVEEFETSLPRHYDKIVNYKVLSCEDVTWKNNLPLWMIFNQDKNFVIDYFDKIKNEATEWIIPVKDCEWIIYNNEPAIQTKKGRIVLISRDEKIKRVQ